MFSIPSSFIINGYLDRGQRPALGRLGGTRNSVIPTPKGQQSVRLLSQLQHRDGKGERVMPKGKAELLGLRN